MLIVFLLIGLLMACGNTNFNEEKWSEEIKQQREEFNYKENYHKNIKDGVYYNPWRESNKSFKGVLKWKFSKSKNFEIKDEDYLPKKLEVSLEELKDKKRYILWIGHMSYLIRVDENFYLLDPIFSERALIPKRYVDVPISIEELISITSEGRLRVLITHNHYDHLDKKTIKSLPKGTEIFVPVGNGDLIKKWGEYDITEMEWGDKVGEVTLVPASHWSKRIGVKKNSALWGSFIVEDGDKTFFLGGDSGYFTGFSELGKDYKIDYAIVSVGAYEPRWFMHESHLNVEESIQAMKDMKASLMIPGHWGTFKLGDEPPGYPKYEYDKIKDKKVKLMDIGELIYF